MNKREEIVERYSVEDYSGGIKRFRGMMLKDIKELISLGFIKETSKHNDSPTVKEFMGIAEMDGRITFHGFAEDPEQRKPACISIEGIEGDGEFSETLKKAFTKLCHNADEFSCDENGVYCWYD